MELVLFIGIQASGKTSFYRERFFETHLRLSLDMLKTRHRERLLVQACVEAKQPFVVDNTNVLAKERADYIAQARTRGFTVSGYFFEPNARRAIVWNRTRIGKAEIPVKGLLGTLKRLERPSLDEGFDRLYRVEIDSENRFVVSENSLKEEEPRDSKPPG